MSWVAVGVMAAGAVMGAKKNQRAKEIEDADRKLAGETQRYSWITGSKAQPIRQAGSMFNDVGQGALSGAMFGQQFGKGGGGGAGADPGLGKVDAAGIGSAQSTGSMTDGGGSWKQMMEDEERKKGMMGGGGFINS